MNLQDDTLNNFIAAKQWKQAFNLCEKKLKKAPGSDYLLVTKIKILIFWEDPTRFQQGLKDLESLFERKPPVADIEALCALDMVLEAFADSGHLSTKQKQTWQRAAVSRPQDAKLHSKWYRTKFDEGDFKGAQQAALIWMKNFPHLKMPFFLYILNTHLIWERSTDEQEKTLAQALAYKYLSKAATYAPESNGENPANGRQIQSYDDRCLLLRVYRAQGRYAEAIDMMSDPHLGIMTVQAGQRWELTRQYMELLEICERWIQLSGLCYMIIGQAIDAEHGESHYGFGKLGDDWFIWQMLIHANSEANPAELAFEAITQYSTSSADYFRDSVKVEGVIQSFCHPMMGPKERNARLALLLFYSTEVVEGRKGQDVLLTALAEFFRDFSTRVVCFLDFKPWLSCLDLAGRKQLLLDAAKIARGMRPQSGDTESKMIFWITSEINRLKLEYHLVISRDWNSHRVDLLTAFVGSCLRLYNQSLHFEFELPVSDRRPGDDAALLAVMGLIRLFKAGRREALLQSIIVLEHMLLQSKHNYDALLILARLYMFLGAGSLALDRYNRLSIKNIQYATISWVLYTRLSSIHPYPASYPTSGKGRTTIAPVDDMSQALDWHKSAEALSRKSVHSMQEGGRWDFALDSLETNHAVFNGFARCLLYAELKRIDRFSSTSKMAIKQRMPVPRGTRDTRDRSAFPDFEGGELTFEQHLPMAGTSSDPDDAWLKHQLFLAYFWDVLHTGYSELNAGELEAMDKGNGWDRYTFTPAEHGTANVVTTLLEFYALYARPQQFEKSAAAEFIRQLFANLESWLTQSSEALTASTASGLYASMSLAPDLKIPVWYHYHELFSYLEQCKFILATLEYALNENKKQPCIDHQYLTSATKALKSECTNLSGNVWHSATTLRDKFRDQAFLQKLDEAALGGSEVGEDQAVIAKEIKNLGHQPEIKKVCWDLRDSWIDALEGVSRTKFA